MWNALSELVTKLDPLERDVAGDQQVVAISVTWTRTKDDLTDLHKLVNELGGTITADEPLA